MNKIFCSLLILITLNVSCHIDSKPGIQENIINDFVSGNINVNVSVAFIGYLVKDINSFGKIYSKNEILIQNNLGGRIIRIYGKNGQIVKKGNLLIAFDSKEIDYKIKKAELQKYSFQKDYESTLMGYRNSLQALTSDELKAVERKIAISSGVETNKVDIELLKNEKKNLNIVAPFTCIISDTEVSENEVISSNRKLFKIYDPFAFVIPIKILESDLRHIKYGVKATVAISSSDKIYNAQVSEINPYIDESGMVSVKISLIGNLDNQIFPGMGCKVEIRAKQKKQQMIVPKSAIVNRKEGKVIFTAKNGRAIWNYVQTGVESSDLIEILSGIKPGDSVITTNNLQLSDNSLIKIK